MVDYTIIIKVNKFVLIILIFYSGITFFMLMWHAMFYPNSGTHLCGMLNFSNFYQNNSVLKVLVVTA